MSKEEYRAQRRRDEFAKIAFDRILRKHLTGECKPTEEVEKMAAAMAAGACTFADAMIARLDAPAVEMVAGWEVIWQALEFTPKMEEKSDESE